VHIASQPMEGALNAFVAIVMDSHDELVEDEAPGGM
jgi:hypothetical protein